MALTSTKDTREARSTDLALTSLSTQKINTKTKMASALNNKWHIDVTLLRNGYWVGHLKIKVAALSPFSSVASVLE